MDPQNTRPLSIEQAESILAIVHEYARAINDAERGPRPRDYTAQDAAWSKLCTTVYRLTDPEQLLASRLHGMPLPEPPVDPASLIDTDCCQ